MSDITTFTVVVGGITPHTATATVTFDSLEDAIREWDRLGVMLGMPIIGGITVCTMRDGIMVRDGWVIRASGQHTYLNPNLALAV